MTTLVPFFAWLESTDLATTIGQSTSLIGFLSAVHLVGLTLLVGSVVVSSLKLLGVVLREQPATETTVAVGYGTTIGLLISVTSGLLLFASRASRAFQNEFFQAKMLLLFAALLFHFAIYRNVIQGRNNGLLPMKANAIIGLLLWFGVVLAGSAYIFSG